MSLIENRYLWIVVIAAVLYLLYKQEQYPLEKMEPISYTAGAAISAHPSLEMTAHQQPCGCTHRAQQCADRCAQKYPGVTPFDKDQQKTCVDVCQQSQSRCNIMPGHSHEALAHPEDQY